MQKRINDVQWSGVSNLPQTTSIKEPKYYLSVIDAEEKYEEDIYFVNNSEEVLPLVIADWLTDDAYQAMNKLAAINHKNEYATAQESIVTLAEAMGVNPKLVYQNVLPYQGVRVATQHMMYSSDGLNQCRISVFANSSDGDSAAAHDDHNGATNQVWKFNVVQSGLFTGDVLLWKDDTVPKSMIAMQVTVE